MNDVDLAILLSSGAGLLAGNIFTTRKLIKKFAVLTTEMQTLLMSALLAAFKIGERIPTETKAEQFGIVKEILEEHGFMMMEKPKGDINGHKRPSNDTPL